MQKKIIKDKVLIVDDRLSNLVLMTKALQVDNIEIQTVKSGSAAIKVLHAEEFSLIIMDVNMPELSGFETAKIILETNIANNTAIIFISSQCKAEADIDTGFEMGAYDYIFRPIDLHLFRNKVRTFLRLHQAERELKQVNILLAEKAAQLDHELLKQKAINDDLKFSEQVFENSINGIIIVDENLKFIRVNRAFMEMTGYTMEELRGKTPHILSSGIQKKVFYEEMWNELVSKGTWQGELWNKKKNNELYAEMLSINAVMDQCGIVSNYIGIVSDITEKKRSNEKNEHLANYDYLTGLPNRLNLMTLLCQYIDSSEIKSIGILFLDLDKFKPVNDQYGHLIGDDLLIAVSKRLKSCIRDTDLVARLGGDEFIVILKNFEFPQASCKKVAEKIITSISTPFHISDVEVNINTSIGISVYPNDGKEADELITLADNAMYVSKAKGVGCFSFS